MSSILAINKNIFRACADKSSRKTGAVSRTGSVLSVKGSSRSRRSGETMSARNSKKEIGFDCRKILSSLVFLVIIFGVVYLYQVNDLASKGYEVRDIENRIENLRKENEKNKIVETELRSMYNIERNTKNLNLVNAGEISYLELGGPVAMK